MRFRAVDPVSRRRKAAPPVHPHNDAFLGSVLAIEDEASVRSALGRLLKTKGVDATIVATAKDALTLVREQGLRPDRAAV